MRQRARRSASLLGLVAAVLLIASCVGSRPTLGEPGVSQGDGGEIRSVSDLAARVPATVAMYDDPGLGGTPQQRATGVPPASGDEVVVRALATTRRAVQVLLGDGSTGWVSRSDVALVTVDLVVVIDVARGTVTVPGEVAFEARATFGPDFEAGAASSTFLADLVQLPEQPLTPWGRRLYVLSGSNLSEANLLSGAGISAIFRFDGSAPLPPRGVGLSAADFDDFVELRLPLGTPVDFVGADDS